MPGKPLRLGPFIGGLNLGSDPTAIADAELVECSNFELDIDGSLVSRPPRTELEGPWSTPNAERILLLCEAIFSGAHYIIGSNSTGVYFYINGSWTLITNTIQASAAVVYANNVYLIAHPSASNPGGKWNPSAGFVAVAALPKGQAAVSHKSRLFVVPGIDATTNQSRLIFSDADNFDAWTASNFIDVNQGDGTNLVDLTVFQDNLLLFKQETVYVLSYDIRPTDAILRRISNNIGVDGQHCVVNYENQIYNIHDGWVYEIINFDFNRINTKVPFVRDETYPSAPAPNETIFLSLLQDRLVCRYYSRVYVYGLRTRTWSEWSSNDPTLKYFGPIVTIHPTSGNEFYAGSMISGFGTLIQLFNSTKASTKELVYIPYTTTSDNFNRSVTGGWGTADTGETWSTLSTNTNFSVNGSDGLISLPAVNTKQTVQLNINKQDVDIAMSITVPVVAVGDWIVGSIQARRQDNVNYYEARAEFKQDATVGLTIHKIIAGVDTPIGGVGLGGTYTANAKYTMRLRLSGSTIKAKLWNSAGNEPGGWTVSNTDTSISATGPIGFSGNLNASNTNTLPVVLKFDALKVGDLTNVSSDIVCRCTTKNFDMAIPNAFKRLWWWGADISTNRSISGFATPVVVSFKPTWADLKTTTWSTLKQRLWNQLLIAPTSVGTTVASGTGTARRFAKFNKGLRYRQINFTIQLVTNGTTLDGPAKLFTMMIVTESKQIVSKALS